MSDLNAALLEAHARGDRRALIGLYMQAAEQAEALDAACFFLTHAYVHALELGDARAGALRARLVEHGREPPDQDVTSL